MTAIISSVIAESEYLQLEEKAAVRHEFINGKLYEMPGGTMYHEKVIINILRFLLKNTAFEVFAQGLRLRPPQTENYFYPDILVTTEKVTKAFYAEHPILIAEVLSPSTRANDFTDKFIAYRQFPSLAYYLLAEPDFCYIILFYKEDAGTWESELYNRLTDTIELKKLSVQLPVSEIYSGLEWADR